MLPSQLKKLIELLRAQFASIHETVDKQTDTAVDQQAANREQIQSAIGSLAAISNKIEAHNQNANISSEKSQEQQGRLITLQGRLVVWAALAFFAAFGYGLVAAWQGWLMLSTYGEMRNQTKAAQRSAWTSCMNANAAIDTLNEIRASSADAHSTAISSMYQSKAALRGQTANINVEFPPRTCISRQSNTGKTFRGKPHQN